MRNEGKQFSIGYCKQRGDWKNRRSEKIKLKEVIGWYKNHKYGVKRTTCRIRLEEKPEQGVSYENESRVTMIRGVTDRKH